MALTAERTSEEPAPRPEKETPTPKEYAVAEKSAKDIVYDNADVEPELHVRSYVALAAFFLSGFATLMAMTGPPAVLTYIGQDLKSPKSQTWITLALSLVQAVLGPILSSASDAFQARKAVLVACFSVSFIGCGIAPGSQGIGRLVAAQVLIGFGFATQPLVNAVISEIVPRRFYPLVQGLYNVASNTGAIASPLLIGALVRASPSNGWRLFYWVQMGVWGLATIGILTCYLPPERASAIRHLRWWQKAASLDLLGFLLLTAGLTLFLVGLGLGGGLYPWGTGRVLGTLISGIAILIAFGIYEWKGTSTGMLHHAMFQGEDKGRIFSLCNALIFVEGVLVFSYVIFYPILTEELFETDPFLVVARGTTYWIAGAIASPVYGWFSTRLRSFRGTNLVGFTLFTTSVICMSTTQPGQSTRAIIYNGIAGAGNGGPVVLLIAATQLSVPHHLIGTATAVLVSTRAIAATIFTASYAAVVNNRAAKLVPKEVTAAALRAGLPSKSVSSLIPGLTAQNQTQLAAIPDLTPDILAASTAALKQAQADSIRYVYVIAAAFGFVGCILCLFLSGLSEKMDYRVEAPVERLQAKKERTASTQ